MSTLKFKNNEGNWESLNVDKLGGLPAADYALKSETIPGINGKVQDTLIIEDSANKEEISLTAFYDSDAADRIILEFRDTYNSLPLLRNISTPIDDFDAANKRYVDNKTKVDSSISSSSTNPVQNKVITAALNNKVSKTTNSSVEVPGTGALDSDNATKTISTDTLGGNVLVSTKGLIISGSAQEAGLVTRGICGVTTPTNTGACTKNNLYINYDGTNTYDANRHLIIQAGTAGAHYGNNLYQYAAARGDAVKGWVEAQGFLKTQYTAGLVTGASATAQANAAATNGNVYLNLVENSTVRNAHNIVGSGSVSVTSDANGKITISGTTYSAGTGISLSGTTINNSGVRSIATGGTNGTISVNTNGTTTNVAVKGLGSAAYTASTAYAAASHTQAASTITAGTLGGKVQANATAAATVGDKQVRDIFAGTSELVPGTSALTTGTLYFVYE